MGNYLVGDCLELLTAMEEKSVEVTVTSPPYNIGIQYGKYKDVKPEEEYLDWLDKIFLQLWRVTKDEGHFFLQVGGNSKDPDKPNRILKRALSRGWTLQNQIIWVKSIAIGEVTQGHFKPVNSKRYLNNLYEFVYHLTKDGDRDLDRLSLGVPYMDKTNIDRLEGVKRDLRCRGNLWFLPYKTVASAKAHPAAFPVEIPKWCIELSGMKGLVLDPFAGSGTTLVAADALGNPSVGMDIDENYKGIYEIGVKAVKE